MVYHSVKAISDSRLSGSGAAKMRCCRLFLLNRIRETHGSRTASRLTLLVFSFAITLVATVEPAKTLPPRSFQGKNKKSSELSWNPPQVDSRMHFVSTAPACSLPDVLKHAGERTGELVDHLKKFIAREQIRYQQTGRPDVSGVPMSGGPFRFALDK
jgi:hypothetical protein